MKKTLLSILPPYLVSRLTCSFFVYIGHNYRDYLSVVPGGWVGVNNWWLNPWTTYDSYWYLRIATSGYEPHTTAFFPLYPFILKLFSHDLLSMALVGVVFSHLCFLVALVLIFKLTEKEHDKTIAHVTTWVICFFPSAAFFGAVYTESLFLALLSGTFLAARNKRWGLCAMLAAATALTRNPGALLAVALYLEIREDQPGINEQVAKWYVPFAPLSAFVSVQFFYWWNFGSPLSGLVSQEYYQRRIMWPWQPLSHDFGAIFQTIQNPLLCFFVISSLFVTMLALIFIIYGYKRIPSSYLVLIGGITLMNLIYGRTMTPSTLCGIRYMGALFPFSQLLAVIILKINNLRIIAPLIVGLQIMAFIIYNIAFGWKSVF